MQTAMYQILSFLAMGSSLLGNLFVAKKKKIGFYIWIASNILWISVNLMSISINISQIFMYVVYTGINIYGIINWSEK